MKKKILMVCLGNICRSPMAELILRERAEKAGLPWEVRSAGTNRYHKGGPADERAIRTCRKFGLDLSSHVARRFTPEDFDRYDVIYSMAVDVTEEIRAFARSPEQMKKVRNFMDHVRVGASVPDPWYDGEEEFEECFRIVEEVCDAIVDETKKNR